MIKLSLLLILAVTVLEVYSKPSFVIDYDGNQFLKDGKPFRYVAGCMHYFRVPRGYWADRLYKLRMGGFNAVQTYTEWRTHEPFSGVYDFSGDADVVSYIKEAQVQGLLVILRLGPYIDAEREMGGMPSWLLQENPDMYLRSNDPSYLKFVDRYYSVLLPKIAPLLYSNGGPVISVQVENEYGSYPACDRNYTTHLRDLYRKYLGNDVIYFTTDGDSTGCLKCGPVPDVYATVDFGPGTNVTRAFELQRTVSPAGPLVNSEYYPGWLDHWGHPHASVSVESTVTTLKQILDANASVSVYMFHGGTSYGFGAGSNLGGSYQFCPTSYDYDALLSEAGDPTLKYNATRELISKYIPLPAGGVPPPSVKYAYDDVEMRYLGSVFDIIKLLTHGSPRTSPHPLSFEQLGQISGYVLYETTLDVMVNDPAVVTLSDVGDRAYLYVDQVPSGGILTRGDDPILTAPIRIQMGQKLQILVENQGRVCVGSAINDTKGILGNVSLSGEVLSNWTMYSLPFNTSSIERVAHLNNVQLQQPATAGSFTRAMGAGLYMGSFSVPYDHIMLSPEDTFINPVGWTKGIVFLNGFNLGRYWPVMGPQVTMYVPKTLLKAYPEENSVIIYEQEESLCWRRDDDTKCLLSFTDTPMINSTTPYTSYYRKLPDYLHQL